MKLKRTGYYEANVNGIWYLGEDKPQMTIEDHELFIESLSSLKEEEAIATQVNESNLDFFKKIEEYGNINN